MRFYCSDKNFHTLIVYKQRLPHTGSVQTNIAARWECTNKGCRMIKLLANSDSIIVYLHGLSDLLLSHLSGTVIPAYVSVVVVVLVSGCHDYLPTNTQDQTLQHLLYNYINTLQQSENKHFKGANKWLPKQTTHLLI